MDSTQFGRLITAMITPFTRDGALDYEMAVKVADHLIKNGTDAILLSGTTGESPTLTHDEEFELYRVIVQEFKGKAKVIAGTGSNSTLTAVNSTKEAEAIGVDGSLQVVPYYNKPSQEGLYQHFKKISESTSLPILLYNIPGRTSRNMEPATIARLAEIPNIIGVKEAAGSVEQVEKIRSVTPDDFMIYSGDDGLTLSFMEKGAYGVVSVAAHVVGLRIKEMMSAFSNGDITKAQDINNQLQAIFEVLFITTNPVPVKCAMRMIGFDVGLPRLPLVDVTEEEKMQIETVLTRYLELV